MTILPLVLDSVYYKISSFEVFQNFDDTFALEARSVASLISVLQLERVRRATGVSLQAISESTKITTTYLRAIESEEFDKLPGGVFNTSYIRQYARAIGFPEADLLALYSARIAAAEESAAIMEAQLAPAQNGVFRACLNWLRNPSPLTR